MFASEYSSAIAMESVLFKFSTLHAPATSIGCSKAQYSVTLSTLFDACGPHACAARTCYWLQHLLLAAAKLACPIKLQHYVIVSAFFRACSNSLMKRTAKL